MLKRVLSLVIAVMLVSLSAGISLASDEIQRYVPTQMTDEQMEEMQAVGAKLVAQIDELLMQYKSQLSQFDLFYYYCLVDHMWDLHIDDEWAGFEEALSKCDSAEAFAAILDMSFQGITKPHSGYLPQEEVFGIAKDILRSAKSEDSFNRMVAIPKTCYDENSAAWQVWLISPDYS
ncbi:MAG: hypothetical protein LBB86_10635, partial [Oscillospiraceae bacterium]|nr:hypothetical protein [Oscillospiraceae bacterium]